MLGEIVERKSNPIRRLAFKYRAISDQKRTVSFVAIVNNALFNTILEGETQNRGTTQDTYVVHVKHTWIICKVLCDVKT